MYLTFEQLRIYFTKDASKFYDCDIHIPNPIYQLN